MVKKHDLKVFALIWAGIFMAVVKPEIYEKSILSRSNNIIFKRVIEFYKSTKKVLVTVCDTYSIFEAQSQVDANRVSKVL